MEAEFAVKLMGWIVAYLYVTGAYATYHNIQLSLYLSEETSDDYDWSMIPIATCFWFVFPPLALLKNLFRQN